MALLSGLLGSPNNGFLTQLGLLGQATPDPLAASLDPIYYNAGDDRASRISQALHAVSEKFGNPQKGQGDLAVLASAANAAGPAYKQRNYLGEAVKRQTTANQLFEQQREKQLAEEEDLAWADLIAQHPEWAGMGRKEAQKVYADLIAQQEGAGGSDKADFSMGNMVEVGVWEDGSLKYGQWQPSYREGVPPRLEIMPKGTVPFTSPEAKGKAAELTETGKLTGEFNTNRRLTAKNIVRDVVRHRGELAAIASDPNLEYYTGFTGIFGENVIRMPEYRAIESKIQTIKSAQFKKFMDESGLHSQISDQDRIAMENMVAAIQPGMPIEDLQAALVVLDEYFTLTETEARKYLPKDEEGNTLDTSTMSDDELVDFLLKKKKGSTTPVPAAH